MGALHETYALLRNFDPRKGRLDDLLDAARARISEMDIGIVLALSDGMLRHHLLLDHLIGHVSSMPPARMERKVLAAIRLGVLSLLRGVPPHAAVNECVGLLPAGNRARGLVNAILRRISENFSSRPLEDKEREGLLAVREESMSSLIGPQVMPLGGERLITCQRPFFPPQRNAALALLAGLPPWLAQKLEAELGDKGFATCAIAAQLSPAVWFRIVRGREDEAEAALARIPHERTGAAIMLSAAASRELLRSEAFAHGALTVQDFCAQQVVAAAQVHAGERCLDLCAAPGGKTCQLAEACWPDGVVLAFDASQQKLDRLNQTLARLRHSNVSCAFGDGRTVTLEGMGHFDVVVVDAPCSNTGVLGRRIETRHRLRESDIVELCEIQRALLGNAARHLRPGGRLVYSTCSLLKDENTEMVRGWLAEHAGWKLQGEALMLPKPGAHDGGYHAVMLKPDAESTNDVG